MAGLHGLYNVNVAGLENSTAGVSSAVGVNNGIVIQKVQDIYCTSVQHERQRRRLSTDRSRGQLKAYPTNTALTKAIETFSSQAVIALVGNLGEGESYIIEQLPSEYDVQHLNDVNELTEQFERLESERVGKVAYIIWDLPDFISDKDKLAEILNAIICRPSPSEADRKYIFICQPWSLKMFKNNMRREFFNEINTVRLTDINGHPNQWRERLELMNRFKRRELDQETKERIAKMVPPEGGFPYLCAAYNGQGPEFFIRPYRLAKKVILRIISSHGNFTAAAFILMVACKGSYKEENLSGSFLEEYKRIVKADLLDDVSLESLPQQFECWRDSILKFENNVWTFKNATWKKACTLVLCDKYDTLFGYCHSPCTKHTSAVKRFVMAILRRFENFIHGFWLLIQKFISPPKSPNAHVQLEVTRGEVPFMQRSLQRRQSMMHSLH